MAEEEVQSESKFVFNLLKDLLLWPITLLLVIFKKKTPADLAAPLKDLWKFLTDAKVTAILILISIVLFILLRLLIYLGGFGFVNSLYTGEGFGNLMEFTGDKTANRPLLDFIAGHFSYFFFITDMLFNNFHIFSLIGLFLSGFTHVDFSHLFGNIFTIFIFGKILEKKYGGKFVLLVYLATHVVGSLLSAGAFYLLLGSSDIYAGASIAAFGLMAAALISSPFYITFTTVLPLPIIIVVMGDVTLQLSYMTDFILAGTATGINYLGHLLGFLCAFPIMYWMLKKTDQKFKTGMVVAVLALAASFVLFFVFGKAGAPPADVILGWIFGLFGGGA